MSSSDDCRPPEARGSDDDLRGLEISRTARASGERGTDYLRSLCAKRHNPEGPQKWQVLLGKKLKTTPCKVGG